MLAARCLLALTLLAVAFATKYSVQYQALMVKGEVGAVLEPRGPYYIPDGQCSALIDGDAIKCGYHQGPSALKVSVTDGLQPEVRIDSDLRRAVVLRQRGPRGCEGLVSIELSVVCAAGRRAPGHRAPRPRRAAPRPLPPAPVLEA